MTLCSSDIQGLANVYRSVICIGQNFNEVSLCCFMAFKVLVIDDSHVEKDSYHRIDERGEGATLSGTRVHIEVFP